MVGPKSVLRTRPCSLSCWSSLLIIAGEARKEKQALFLLLRAENGGRGGYGTRDFQGKFRGLSHARLITVPFWVICTALSDSQSPRTVLHTAAIIESSSVYGEEICIYPVT